MSKVGDIFTIPLDEESVAIGQIVVMSKGPGPCLIVVFKEEFKREHLPLGKNLEEYLRSEPIFMANSFDTFVEDGTWQKQANMTPALASLKLPAFRVPIGLSFSLMLESYDGKQKRFPRRVGEMFAPTEYAVSSKWLENAVKAHFGRGTWERRHDKLLYKNVVPFQR
jgi:hypothetical protein